MKSFYQYINEVNLLKYLQISALFLFVSLNSYSANIDSLKALLKSADEDSMKAALFLKLGKLELNRNNTDSAIYFYNKALIV